jgi:trans-2-enoyl-CoA reductase
MKKKIVAIVVGVLTVSVAYFAIRYKVTSEIDNKYINNINELSEKAIINNIDSELILKKELKVDYKACKNDINNKLEEVYKSDKKYSKYYSLSDVDILNADKDSFVISLEIKYKPIIYPITLKKEVHINSNKIVIKK